MEIINSIILFFCLIFLILIYFKKNKPQNIQPNIPMTQYLDNLKLLTYYMEKAYSIIYKDRIYVHSLDSARLTQSEINTAIKDFVNLTKKFIGPTLLNNLVQCYGNDQTLYFNMSEYFISRYEDDDIYKATTDNMIRSD